jgi:hypothetical protein
MSSRMKEFPLLRFKILTMVSTKVPVCPYRSTFSRQVVHFYQTARCRISEGTNLHLHFSTEGK